ncbi:hypothetical protein BDA99DRAFT_559010 [Phascolomyces articulosus]|uniref:Uncharacterized protein n=1 Tax=Phascolomyces articulosus TaxID=60185 RepID=A0AAD5K1T6_9FUNG|nr:hypothetical protein BDA99DRAFT_559010 [Phascolomyces articulosus]
MVQLEIQAIAHGQAHHFDIASLCNADEMIAFCPTLVSGYLLASKLYTMGDNHPMAIEIYKYGLLYTSSKEEKDMFQQQRRQVAQEWLDQGCVDSTKILLYRIFPYIFKVF